MGVCVWRVTVVSETSGVGVGGDAGGPSGGGGVVGVLGDLWGQWWGPCGVRGGYRLWKSVSGEICGDSEEGSLWHSRKSPESGRVWASEIGALSETGEVCGNL